MSTPTPITVKETVEVKETIQVKETVQVVITSTPPPTPAPRQGGTLIAARTVDAKGLDPHKQTMPASLRMLELIYDPLLTFDKNLQLIPNLAETWKWSSDNKILTLTLRQNVKFHNGDMMTSDDVKFSLERIMDERTGAAARASFSDIDKIETPDVNTVVLTLKKANATILTALANLNAAIINKKQVMGGADPAKVDVGTGAFKLDKWDPDRTLTMTANRDFWIPGLPRLDGIEWRTMPDESAILNGLRTKTLDWALISDPRVAIRANSGGSTLNILSAPSLTFHVFQLNSNRPALSDVKIRQAIACAIDRQEVLDAASLGEGEVVSPATAPYYRANLSDLFCYAKDADKTKQLLNDANKSTGLKFKIMVASDEPASIAEAQNIQAQLKKSNIDTDIETIEHNAYVDRWNKVDFDATVTAIGGSAEPDAMFYRYWHSAGNLNKVAAYSNFEIDRLLEQGRTTTDAEKRKSIYNEVQKKLTEAAPWIWLYVGYEYRIGQPYVKGFTPLPNGSLIYLRDVSIEK